jgi:hypothetical protein
MSTKTFAPPPMPHPADYRPVVRALLRWYRVHGRALPWRGTSSTYRILLSEVMLQQTQVSRVLVKYPQFLRRFPTLRSLARARQRDVVTLWRGMGYNNRAVRLYRLARQVTEHHAGRIPRKHELLLALPGIGEYTASAIRSRGGCQCPPRALAYVQTDGLGIRRATRTGNRSSRPAGAPPDEGVRLESGADGPRRDRVHGARAAMHGVPRLPLVPVNTPDDARDSPGDTNGTGPQRHPEQNLPRKDHRYASKHRATSRCRSRNTRPSWLDALLDGLERDELIRVRGNGTATGKRVALR